jgi:hypothetical protein
MQLPTIVAGATLKTPGDVLGEGLLALDVLTVHPEPRPAPITLRVGEVKVYPDRGGFTDGLELATARAQAGLYVYVLQRTVEALGLTRDLHVAEDGFLVLARPASNQPSVRAGRGPRVSGRAGAGDVRAARPLQADLAAGRVDARRRCSPRRSATATRASRSASSPTTAATRPCAQGLPTALGEDLARFLGDVSLHRALELLRGDEAQTDAERDFLRRSR